MGLLLGDGTNRRNVQRRMRGAQNTSTRSAGHWLKEKEYFAPFVKRKAFFLLRMRHLLFR